MDSFPDLASKAIEEMERAKELVSQGSLDEAYRLLNEFIEARRTVGGAGNAEELSEAYSNGFS